MGKPSRRARDTKTSQTASESSFLNNNSFIVAAFVAGVAITCVFLSHNQTANAPYSETQPEFKRAADVFQRKLFAAQSTPGVREDPLHHFQLGLAAQQAGEWHEAEQRYVLVLSALRSATSSKAHQLYGDTAANLGALYMELDDLPSAFQVLKAGMQMGVKHADMYGNMAVVLHKLGDSETASLVYEQAQQMLDYDPTEEEEEGSGTYHDIPMTRPRGLSGRGVYLGNYSAIVPVYIEDEAEAELVLQSLLGVVASAREYARQLTQPGHGGELIVVNDASPNDVFDKLWEAFQALPEVLQNLETSLKIRAPLHLTTNVGAGAARNEGARVATGDWLLFCDADDVWLSKHVATVLAPLQADDQLTHARTRVEMLDVPGEQVHPDWMRSISATLPSTLAVARDVHLFFEGFPIHERYAFGRNMEDVHYALVLQDTPGQYVNTFTVQYRWRRGGRLDQQLPKFRQPMDNSRELAAELERYHQTPSERWYVYNAMRYTGTFKILMQHKAHAVQSGTPLPPALDHTVLPPLMHAAPWLESNSSEPYGVVPYSGANEGSIEEVARQTTRAKEMGLNKPKVILVLPQPIEVLETGAFAWMKFPAGALDRCAQPCVWLQHTEDVGDVDAALHYCGHDLPPLREEQEQINKSPKSVYLCAEQLQDRFTGVELADFDVTMTQKSSSHIPLRYAPPPAVWEAAREKWPTHIQPSKDEHAAVAALFMSNNASQWEHCSKSVEKERCWGRYTFLEELMRNIKVDSFGGLLHNKDMEDIIDELNHEKHHGSSLSFLEGDKLRTIAKGRYPFTLAFENNVEDDYVSEKMYEPLLAGSVPIYFGAPNAISGGFAPLGSFIDASQFDSPAELAVHLKDILAKPDRLQALHAWRTNVTELEKFRAFTEGSMYSGTLEEVSAMPIWGVSEFTPAWLNNPKRVDVGRVEPHFNPCAICDFI